MPIPTITSATQSANSFLYEPMNKHQTSYRAPNLIGPNIEVQLRAIDPKTASDWLNELNISRQDNSKWVNETFANRKISDKTVTAYANAMKQGEWTLSPQGIAFNERGELIDGQHRLCAIVESETTQEMIVFSGWSEDTIRVLDSGMRRMAHQALQITTDFNVTRQMVAALRIASTPIHLKQVKLVSVQGLSQLYSAYQESIEFVESTGVKVAPVLAASLRAYIHFGAKSDEALLIRDFLEIFEEGYLENRPFGAEDKAATMLRRYYDSQYKNRSGEAMMLYRRTIRALSDFINRIPKKNTAEMHEQIFPIKPAPRSVTGINTLAEE